MHPIDTEQLVRGLRTDTNLPEVDGALLAFTAQQAVLPRQLDDGQVYAILDAEGGIQIATTPSYDRNIEREDASTPYRIERCVRTTTVDSFLDYIAENTVDGKTHAHNEHQDGSLEIWADIDTSTITAHLDGYDGWRFHKATLNLTNSPEWAEWNNIDGELLPQDEFAEFIEDHLSTIAEPDGAKLLEISQTLTGHTDVQWRSQQILASGQRQFKWEEQVDAKAGTKGDLTIPAELTLVLRPYRGGDQVAMPARFRFRLRNGELLIGVKLIEPQRVLEEAFNAVIEQVNDSTHDEVMVRSGRG